jgi:glycosyltransferase involved in cell wall biosynthesis
VRVVQIVPGSGNTFYCENCLRDLALVRALRAAGHDVVLVPMYLPLFTDDGAIAEGAPVFFGGISTWLREKSALFRHAPRWSTRWLDAPALLRLAAQRAGSTRAHGLGRMTLSMIRGEAGSHAAEINRLAEWLSATPPDVVQISNALLVGLVRPLQQRLRAPVVCLLQDEDTWLDALDAPFDRECWDALRERSAEVNAFVAVSDHYRSLMLERLELRPERVFKVPVGIDVSGYEPAPQTPAPPAVGYLAKMTPSLGLGLLFDAFLQLKREPGLQALQLRAMGGQTGDDRRFLASLRLKAATAGVAADVQFLEDFDRPSRIAFLRGLSVLSVPVPAGEAAGMFVLESLAAGVPVVQPRCGAFPELLEATGGGLLCEPNNVASLAAALGTLLRDPARGRALGAAGRQAVLDRYTVQRMAAGMAEVYAHARARGGGPLRPPVRGADKDVQ